MGKVTVTNNLTFERAPTPQLPADSPEVAALAGHLRAGRCALFVGAGLSAPAGLPTWGALIDRMVTESTPWAVDLNLFPPQIELEDPAAQALRKPPLNAIRASLGAATFSTLCRRLQHELDRSFDLQVLDKALSVMYQDSIDRADLLKLAGQKRYAELAGACRDRLGRDRFRDLIRNSLTTVEELPPTHRDIVRTPFSCVVTTNFDTLIEDAYARYGTFGVPRAPTGAELGQQGTLLLDRGFFVLKAHGDAARPETMVFTADDYRRVIHANPAFQAVIGGILLTHAVLFVGYSLSDPNFRLLLDNHLTIFNDTVPPRYAILGGIGAAECDILWKTAKLQVLPYPEGQHQEVGRCLAALADQTTNGARAETKRSVSHPRRRPPDLKSEPCITLVVESDGDRMGLELVRRHPEQGAERLWAGGGVQPDTRALRKSLQEADRGQMLGRSPAPLFAGIGRALAGTLPPPLRRELAAIPRGSLVEIACSPLATRIPWEWTSVSREPLAYRNAVVRRPAEITHEARGLRSVNRPLRALVFGDAGTGDGRGGVPLQYADLEARTIELLLRANDHRAVVTCLSRKAATHARVLQELEHGDYDVIHFGGHAWFDAREAFFVLWDRVMLGSELAPLLSRRPPALMVLDTHYSAFVLAEIDTDVRELVGSPRRAGTLPPSSPPRGFAEAAMRCGVASFVGAFGSIADRSGAELSVAFFAHLLSGTTTAEALRAAREQTAQSTLDSGMFYTVFGYPDFRLVTGGKSTRRTGQAIARWLAQIKARAGWDKASQPTR